MSVVERITRQILPLLVVTVGIALLLEFYFVNTSEYYNAAEALMVCGILAPIIQLIGVALAKEEKRRVLLVACGSVVAVLSLLIITFGEYVVSYVFNYYPSISYYLELGYVVDAAAAIAASVIVIGIAFWSTRVNEKTVVDAA